MEGYFEGLSNVKVNEDNEIYVPPKYGERTKSRVLVEGDYNGRHFAIIRHHLGFPDAYIELKPEDWIVLAPIDANACYCRYDLYDGSVHGGATYYGGAYWNEADKRTYLGWDYGHCSDFEAYSAYLYDKEHDKKWNLLEIMMAIGGVEADIIRQNEDHFEERYKLMAPEKTSDGT